MALSTLHLPGAHTHQGARKYQQDAFGCGHFCADGIAYGAFAIADGLGWSAGSEVIAQTAVGLAVRIAEGLDPGDPGRVVDLTRIVLPEVGRYASTENRVGWCIDAFADETTRRAPDTTLVVTTVNDSGEIHGAWVGDSRAYILTVEGRLIQLTDDHNMAAFSGSPHTLNRSLRHPGGPAPAFSWHTTTGPDRARRLLLCTDGVHGALAPGGDGRAVGRQASATIENEHRQRIIRHILRDTRRPGRAAIQLVEWAVRAGGDYADNATALVVDIPEPTV